MKTLTKFAIFLLILIAFTLSFFNNFWGIVEPKDFHEFQRDSESLIVGQLAYNRHTDSFVIMPCRIKASCDTDSDPGRWERQYTYFEKGVPPDSPSFYESHANLEGNLFSLIDWAINGTLSITWLYVCVSCINALFVALLIYYFYLEFGLRVACVSGVGLFFSRWLIVWGNNLYYFLTFLAPFVIAFIIAHELRTKKICSRKICALYGLLFFVCFVRFSTGYEYISTIGISILLPSLYLYLISKESQEKRKYFINFLLSGCLAFAGILSSIALWITMLYFHYGSLDKVIYKFFFTIYYRSGYDLAPYLNMQLPVQLEESINAPLINVIVRYLVSPFFFPLILLFLVALVYIFFKRKSLKDQRLYPLSIITLLALLGAFSWHVMCKGHSYIHPHMNFITYYIAFIPFLLILLTLLFNEFKKLSRLLGCLLLFYFLISILPILLIRVREFNTNNQVEKVAVYAEMFKYRILLSEQFPVLKRCKGIVYSTPTDKRDVTVYSTLYLNIHVTPWVPDTEYYQSLKPFVRYLDSQLTPIK